MIVSTTTGNSDRASGSLLMAAVGTLLTCGALLVYGSGRGYDLTDEVFYLVWTRDPEAYQLTYQPFGYLLHPLFDLVRQDLQIYRLSGFAIAAAAGAFLGQSLLFARGRRLLFAIYGACSALTIFFPWIITPSYNSAANVGAMLILGGIFSALENGRGRQLVGCCAIGPGLCIAAFSKPPLFAIAVCAVVLGALVYRRSRAALAGSLLLAAVLISAILSPLRLAELMQRMALTQHILSLPNTPLALPLKIVRDWSAVPAPLIAAGMTLVASLAMGRRSWSKWLADATMAIGIVYVATLLPDAIDGEIPDFLGLALLMIVAGYAALSYAEQRRNLSVIAMVLIAPVAVGIGTFNNQWFQLNFSMAFAFIALFSLAALDPRRLRRSIAQLFAILGPIAVMLLAAWAPYSLPAPIFEQHVAIAPPLASGTILVDDETADFINTARGLARGGLLIDLSGAGPGVAVALEGRAPILSWLNPATPTWPDVVWSRLSPKQREDASFIDPVLPNFRSSQPAQWLFSHERNYCTTQMPEMPFWGKERTLRLRRPCPQSAARASAAQ